MAERGMLVIRGFIWAPLRGTANLSDVDDGGYARESVMGSSTDGEVLF